MDRVSASAFAKGLKKRLVNDRTLPYLLMAPAVAFIVLVVVYPAIRTVAFSFTDYVLWRPFDIKFIGLGNYIKLLRDEDFILSFTNTLKWVVIILLFQFVLGFAVALMLHRRFRWRELLRAIVLIPWITPSILTALMWVWMYHGSYGVINEVLFRTGIIKDFIPWLAQASTSLYSCMVPLIWQGMPFFTIMLIAGLSSIPEDLYEAGMVDGTSPFQAFVHITLPCLKNTILVTTLLRTIWIANNVDIVYIMTGGGPANSSLTLSVNTYITAQRGFNFGYASAMAVCLTILLTIAAIFYIRNMNLSGVEK